MSSLQNWSPLTELPKLSSGGDQRLMPITLGMTTISEPLPPALAGSPTMKANLPESVICNVLVHNVIEYRGRQIHKPQVPRK